MSGRPSPDRRLRVAAVGLGLWAVPSRGYRAVSTSPGGPAGLSPPRRPYRSRHLREFPVSPYSGRQPRSRSSGNTTGLQRFSQNKEEEGQVSLFLVPKGKRRTPRPQLGAQRTGQREPTSADGTHPEGPRGTPVSYQLAKDPQGDLSRATDANGAAGGL